MAQYFLVYLNYISLSVSNNTFTWLLYLTTFYTSANMQVSNYSN